jgi:hypothetical protein
VGFPGEWAVRRVSDAAFDALDAVLASRFAEEVVDHVLESPLVRRTTTRVLDGPELDRVADQAAARLLETDALWRVVDEIARSPAVTEAIAKQSVGFADQVAGGVRARSRSADVWVEQRARRLLRRSDTP